MYINYLITGGHEVEYNAANYNTSNKHHEAQDVLINAFKQYLSNYELQILSLLYKLMPSMFYFMSCVSDNSRYIIKMNGLKLKTTKGAGEVEVS